MRGARFLVDSSLRNVVGRELTDEEVRKGAEAGRAAVEPLIAERGKMLRAWAPNAPLTQAQMIEIMDRSVATAREVEKNLVETIDKLPGHREACLRRDGGLAHLRAALADAPKFRVLIDTMFGPSGPRVMPGFSPGVLPGFRTWIDHLLSRSETGIQAIADISENLSNWLRMRAIVSGLHSAAIATINGFVTLAKGAGDLAAALPGALPKIGLAIAAILGGVAVVGAIAAGSKSK